jgi:hypothetical protein
VHFLNFAEPGAKRTGFRGSPGASPSIPRANGRSSARQVRAASAEAPEEIAADPALADHDLREPERCWPAGPPAFTSATDPATRGKTEAERQCDIYVIEHSVYKRDNTFAFIPPSGAGEAGGSSAGMGRNGDTYTQFFRIPADGLRDGEEAVQITSDEVNKSFQEFSRDGRWILYTVNHSQAEMDSEDTPVPEDRHEAPESWSDEPASGDRHLPGSGAGGTPEELHRVRGQVRGQPSLRTDGAWPS